MHTPRFVEYIEFDMSGLSSMPSVTCVQHPAIHRTTFCIGGVSIRIASESYNDVALDPLLASFRCLTDCPDIDLQVEWTPSLFVPSGCKLFDSGSIWRLYERGDGLQFDFSAPAFGGMPYKRLLVDHGFRYATLQMNEACFADARVSPYPLEYPLDELLVTHRLTQERAIELHSCGIVAGEVSNLFVGHSGAGKSTTSRLWAARPGVNVLSDDRIILRHHSGRILMYGTPWHGEAAFALPASTPLARIFVIEHGHGNVLTRLSPSQAVAELYARSFVPFHRHEYVESALEFLHEVVDSVPVYRYAFEPDERAVEKIIHLHD
jgi:hypothetical protein